jgi:hypothetical protein
LQLLMCQQLIIFVSNTVQSLHQVVVSERRSNAAAAAQAMQYKSASCCTCTDGRLLGQLYVKESMLVHSGVWFSGACLSVCPAQPAAISRWLRINRSA